MAPCNMPIGYLPSLLVRFRRTGCSMIYLILLRVFFFYLERHPFFLPFSFLLGFLSFSPMYPSVKFFARFEGAAACSA